MTRMLAALLVGAMVVWCPDSADPQDLGDLFRKVNSSVVVIRARGRDVGENAFPGVAVPSRGARPMSNTCGAGRLSATILGCRPPEPSPPTGVAVSQSGSMGGIAVLRRMEAVFRAIAVRF
jgi:hypothetical protein